MQHNNELGEVVIPRHVAIIMDGNGRWAQLRSKARVSGHKAGAKSLRTCVEYAISHQIKILTLFAFSSENWKRPALEIKALMTLFSHTIKSELNDLHKHNIKLRFIGNLDSFDQALKEQMLAAMAMTSENTGLQLNIAVSYGGRWEILQACQELVKSGLDLEHLSEQDLRQHLQIQDDIDLLIRTGGEQRVSNFLLYQLAYAEIFFSQVLWPDFDAHAFDEALAFFSQRERRFGMTSEQLTGQI